MKCGSVDYVDGLRKLYTESGLSAQANPQCGWVRIEKAESIIQLEDGSCRHISLIV